MPVSVQTGRAATRHPDVLEIGLLNNLSDAGLEGGERQFIDRLRHAAGSRDVRLRLFSLPSISRGGAAMARIDAIYTPFQHLFDTPLDGLIVTGCEPHTADLRDEPFWDDFTSVVDWAGRNTRSTIWSCLAAHAAVLHLDGIERHRQPDKISGLYAVETVSSHPLLHDMGAPRRVPHSRYNDLAERDLVEAGYEILTRSTRIGVDAFARQDDSLFLFLQGHPEYDAGALFREYRRDVLRFLDRTRNVYPAIPAHYCDDALTVALEAFAVRAHQQRDHGLFTTFPPGFGHANRRWNDNYAATIFGNWLHGLYATTAEHVA